MPPREPSIAHLFVGSLNRESPYFQGARGKGIAAFRFDQRDGSFEPLSETTDVDNPTFLAVDDARRRIYAVSEVFGWKEGIASAYRFDEALGTLIYLNKQPTLGSISAFASLDASARYLLVSNYAMGEGGPDQAVAVLPIRPDGGLAPAIDTVAHAGSSLHPQRQTRSHPHCIIQVPGTDILLVPDLGIDRVISYRLHPGGSLERRGSLDLPAGAGPRHVACLPNGRIALVVNELASTVTAFRIDAGTGDLVHLLTEEVVPGETPPRHHCADIQASADGRFLYISDRARNIISAFRIRGETGALTHIGRVSSGGVTPRNFTLTPNGHFVLVANQNSDAVAVFARDPGEGTLHDTGGRIPVGTPMCVRAALFT